MSGGVPAGWVLVPVEPTEAMLDAGTGNNAAIMQAYEDDGWRDITRAIWSAMLAATPTPPIEGRDAGVERVEMLARIIDPAAFVGCENMTAYGVELGDTLEEAKATAEWAHSVELAIARGKARAALQALGERGCSDGV